MHELANLGSGNVENGTHLYLVTFYSRVEETPPGISPTQSISINITDKTVNGMVYVFNIPVSLDSRVIGRNIYRTKANDNIYYYLGSLSNNFQTSFVDNKSDNDLSNRFPPVTNTKEHNIGTTFGDLTITLINNVVKFTENFNSMDNFDGLNLIVSGNSDIELLSFGYKILGERSCQYLTKFIGTNPKKMIKNLDGYFLLQKDSKVNFQQFAGLTESTFGVKAYGNFINGRYYQNPATNNYDDIKINVELNKVAVEKAFYILDGPMNNYSINMSSLLFNTDSVAIVDNSGNLSNNNMMVNNKYILANFQNTTINNTDFFTTIDNIDVFNKNGGILYVIVQAVYAAIFKQFNKSSSIYSIGNSIVNNSFNLQNNISDLLANEVKESNISLTASKIYTLYESSGRLKNNPALYGKSKRPTNEVNSITMDLEDMEIKFNCKLRGLITAKLGNININKQLSETIFGKYNNGIMEPQTLVREVIRSGTNTFGYDEKNYKMDMINNTKDNNGNYIVNKEIQYEIIFRISLVQKNR
jgi:hypothetical protein